MMESEDGKTLNVFLLVGGCGQVSTTDVEPYYHSMRGLQPPAAPHDGKCVLSPGAGGMHSGTSPPHL